MTMRYLTVDGMLSGTGIRDSVEGGYLNLEELGLSDQLVDRIFVWLSDYEDAHFMQYEDQLRVEKLDKEGIEICTILKKEIPDSKIEYFSSATMQKLILN